MSSQDLVIVGAGVAGLSLGRELARRGNAVTVLERSRGLGGRCATRRIEGRPVDHGLPLLHGRAKGFVEELLAFASSGVTPVFDWPHHLRGAGTPCQPQAYRSTGVRLAVAEGVSSFAKHLAHEPGLEVELLTTVERIALDFGGFRLATSRGKRRASTLVLTCPVDQTLELLQPLRAGGGERDELSALVETVRTVHTLACLTLIAGYREAPALEFHLRLPGPPSPIHSLVNDGSKRPGEGATLVLQAQPYFSRAHLEEPEDRWAAELLASCAELLGGWAARPSWQQTHRWRHARVARGSELSHPSLLRFPGGARLGLCGDAFHPAGGLEGAYLSGIELAARIGSDAASSLERPGPAGSGPETLSGTVRG